MTESPTPDSIPDLAGLLDQLKTLEKRVSELESATPTTESSATDQQLPTLWALEGLAHATNGAGGILFAGDLPQTANGPVSWQHGRTADYFNNLDFTAASGRLDALGHPARLGILQEIYRGTTTVAELSELGRFGSTGQIYHHVQQLAGAGWLESPQRGQWRIPTEHIVPVLTIILAAMG